jgi:hypothetical protein
MSTTDQDYGFMMLKLEDNPVIDKILYNIEAISKNKPYNQVCIFNSSNDKINSHNVPIFHLNQSKFFFGNLFLFDIQSAIISKSYPNIYKRYFYAATVPWEKNLVADHREWSDIFNAENIEIIAQNQYIADIYEICWKKPILIAEDFTYEKIKSILE